tara:strand:+ start:845 stop:1033 length:189 start_codon:yes stop_codon:yes gene_type:complete
MKRDKDKFAKYEYLIWKHDEGFMHTERFSNENISSFIDSLKSIIKERDGKEDKPKKEKSNEK